MHPVTVVAKQHRPVRPRTRPTRARIGVLSTVQKLADIARLRVNRHAIAHIIKVPERDQIPRRKKRRYPRFLSKPPQFKRF